MFFFLLQTIANDLRCRQAGVDVAAHEQIKAVRDETVANRMRKRADQCLSDIKKKRELAARTDKPIGIGQDAYGKDSDTINTAGLATCFGIAVTGTWSEGTSGDFDRAMSHTYADAAKNPEVIEAFERLVTAVSQAKQGGLNIDRVVMVATDPDAYKLEDGWTQEEIDMYVQEYAAYVEAITGLIGAPEEKKHHYDEVWQLSIKSDKTIECGPEGGDNKC